MKKSTWKFILMVNSGLWILSAIFCVYATTYGILTLDWHRFIYGIVVFGIFCIAQAVVGILGD